jgi:hypothetical protein
VSDYFPFHSFVAPLQLQFQHSNLISLLKNDVEVEMVEQEKHSRENQRRNNNLAMIYVSTPLISHQLY